MAKPSIEQLCELYAQIKTGRVRGDNMQRFLDNPDWDPTKSEQKPVPASQFKSEFSEPTITSYTITIRHGETFAQRIKRLACNWLHPWITEKNTPVTVDKKKGVEKKEVFTVHFNREIESDDAVAAMATLDPPLKPAVHEDLIAFGTDHKEVQREFPVVQLGSSWEHPGYGRVVSTLHRDDSVRGLDLDDWRGEGRSRCRFLAVRA